MVEDFFAFFFSTERKFSIIPQDQQQYMRFRNKKYSPAEVLNVFPNKKRTSAFESQNHFIITPYKCLSNFPGRPSQSELSQGSVHPIFFTHSENQGAFIIPIIMYGNTDCCALLFNQFAALGLNRNTILGVYWMSRNCHLLVIDILALMFTCVFPPENLAKQEILIWREQLATGKKITFHF